MMIVRVSVASGYWPSVYVISLYCAVKHNDVGEVRHKLFGIYIVW